MLWHSMANLLSIDLLSTTVTVLKCPDPEIIGNASRNVPNVTSLGSSVTYNCNDGYMFPDDSTSLQINCTAPTLAERNWTEITYNNCLGRRYFVNSHFERLSAHVSEFFQDLDFALYPKISFCCAHLENEQNERSADL